MNVILDENSQFFSQYHVVNVHQASCVFSAIFSDPGEPSII